MYFNKYTKNTHKKKTRTKKKSLKRYSFHEHNIDKESDKNPKQIIGGASLFFTSYDENIPCMLKFNYTVDSTLSATTIDSNKSTPNTITPQLLDWMITDSNHDKLLEVSSVTGNESSYKKNKKYLKTGDVDEFIKFGFGTLSMVDFDKTLISKSKFDNFAVPPYPPPIACSDNDIIQIIIGSGDQSVSKGTGLYDKYKNSWQNINVITKNGSRSAYIKAFSHKESHTNPEFWLEIAKKLSNDGTIGWSDLPKTDKTRDIFLTIDAVGFVGLNGLALPNKINKESGEYKFGTSGLIEHTENLRINTVYSSTTCADQATSISANGFNLNTNKKRELLISNLNTVYNDDKIKQINDSDIPINYNYSEHIKSYLLIDSSDFETSNTKHKEAITHNKTLCSFKNTDYNIASRSVHYDAADITTMLSRDPKVQTNLQKTKIKGTSVDRFLFDNINNCVTDTGNSTSAGDIQKSLRINVDSDYYLERNVLSQMKRLGDYTQIAYAIDLPKRLLSLYKTNSDDIFGKHTNIGNLTKILDGNTGTTLSDKKTDIDFSETDNKITEQFRRRHIHATIDNPAFAYSVYNGVNSMLTISSYYLNPAPRTKTDMRSHGCVVCIFDNPI